MMQIVNQGRVDVEYKMAEYLPVIKKTYVSNRSVTYIMDERLQIEKYVNKKCATYFDILEYRVEIKNISAFTITGVCFYDYCPLAVMLIPNSLKVNGKWVCCSSLKKGIYFKCIKANEVITVTFKVVICLQRMIKRIINKGCIRYDYVFDITLPPVIVSKESNQVSTCIQNRLFTCTTVDARLLLPCCYKRVFVNKILSIKIRQFRHKVITINGEHFILIMGEIIFKTLFKARKWSIPLYSSYIAGFSAKMKVPNGIEYCNITKIQYKLDECYVHRDRNCQLCVVIQLFLIL